MAVVPFCDTYCHSKSVNMKRKNHGHLIHPLSEDVADRSPIVMQRPSGFRRAAPDPALQLGIASFYQSLFSLSIFTGIFSTSS